MWPAVFCSADVTVLKYVNLHSGGEGWDGCALTSPHGPYPAAVSFLAGCTLGLAPQASEFGNSP